MSTTVTPVARHTGATFDRASAGERMMMDGGATPLKDVIQTLADRAQYARGATWGNLVGGDEFAVDTGGTSTVFVARVNAFESLVAQDTSGVFWPRYSTADTTWTLADLEGGAPNLAGDRFYYCYLGVNTDGSLRKQISLTGPGASKTWKSNGVNQWRYLGCFCTSSTGAPYPMRCVRGRALYRRGAIAGVASALGSNGLRALTATAETGITTVDVSSRVPPHSRVALVQGEMVATSTGNAGALSLVLRTADDSTSAAVEISANVNGVSNDTTRNSSLAEIELTSTQRFAYSTSMTSGASALLAAAVDLLGWLE